MFEIANVNQLNLTKGYLNSKGVCWTCGIKDRLEPHHIIPVSYGGKQGALVHLCPICHSKVHSIADLNTDTIPPDNQLSGSIINQLGDSNIDQNRVYLLVKTILVAKFSTKTDKNKTTLFMDRFPSRTNRELKQLAKTLKLNQKEVVRLAVNTLYKQYIKKKTE